MNLRFPVGSKVLVSANGYLEEAIIEGYEGGGFYLVRFKRGKTKTANIQDIQASLVDVYRQVNELVNV